MNAGHCLGGMRRPQLNSLKVLRLSIVKESGGWVLRMIASTFVLGEYQLNLNKTKNPLQLDLQRALSFESVIKSLLAWQAYKMARNISWSQPTVGAYLRAHHSAGGTGNGGSDRGGLNPHPAHLLSSHRKGGWARSAYRWGRGRSAWGISHSSGAYGLPRLGRWCRCGMIAV